MNEIQVQIRAKSTQASRLSQEATLAFRAKNFTNGKRLMAQAVAASIDCQRLIQQYIEQEATAN
jgi:uncharacterized protein YciW